MGCNEARHNDPAEILPENCYQDRLSMLRPREGGASRDGACDFRDGPGKDYSRSKRERGRILLERMLVSFQLVKSAILGTVGFQRETAQALSRILLKGNRALTRSSVRIEKAAASQVRLEGIERYLVAQNE